MTTLTWSPTWSERFDRYVVTTPDHWLWIGGVDPDDGYGRMKVGGRLRRAHRLAYLRWVGPLDVDDTLQVVEQTCDEKRCVRPEHLRLVSYQDSVRRAHNPVSDNGRKEACVRGHPFNLANTYPVPSGGRACRTCRSEWVRAYRLRRARERASVLATPGAPDR